MEKQKVLVIGGGFGGVFAAKALERHGRGKLDVELVNANNYFVFQPLLPEVAASSIHSADAVVPLRRLLRRLQVRQAEALGTPSRAPRKRYAPAWPRARRRSSRRSKVEAPGRRRRYRDYLPPTETLAAQARASIHGGQHGRIRVLKASLAAAVVSSLGFVALQPAAASSHTVARAKVADKARNAQSVAASAVSKKPRPGSCSPRPLGGDSPPPS